MIAPIEDSKHASEIQQSRSRPYARAVAEAPNRPNRALEFSRQMIGSHPVVALAVAAAVGVSAAMLIKRRH